MQRYIVYGKEACFLCPRLDLLAKLCGFEIEYRSAESLEKCEDCCRAANVERLPYNNYPALLTLDGLIMGCHSAMRYMSRAHASSPLGGKTLVEQCRIDSALDSIMSSLCMPLCYAKRCEKSRDCLAESINRFVEQLDRYLLTHSFVASEELSIADVALAHSVKLLQECLPSVQIAKFENLLRLVHTVYGRAGMPESECTRTEGTTACASKPEASGEKPASAFDMEAWKRKYSNSRDVRGDAMKWFWENYDPAQMCTYCVKYQRYDDTENVVDYMASNLLAMFLQRIDNSVRKVAFGVFNVLKEADHYAIEGAMTFNLSTIPQMMQEHDQFTSFTWEKLDPVQHKKEIEDYFCEESALRSREIIDCKVFK